MKRKKVLVPIVILFISYLLLQCSLGIEPIHLEEEFTPAEQDGLFLASKSSKPTGGMPADTAANNLSVPVIWSDGVGLSLPGDPDIESFVNSVPLTMPDNTIMNVYPQQDPQNSWQAESVSAVTGDPDILVDFIDWGDNLEAKSWPLGSKIRVETVLYKSFPGPEQGMKGYDMYFISGQGMSESWGTSGVSRNYNHEGMAGYNALIYSGCAKLVIQKITGDPATVSWSESGESGGLWVGEGIGVPIFNRGVWDSIPGDAAGYTAEINIGGKVIYGFNWDTRILAEGVGTYRLTFALAGGDMPLKPVLNTVMDETTKIFTVEEATVLSEEDGDSGEPDLGGGTPFILEQYNLTYIDVTLTDKGGKGRK